MSIIPQPPQGSGSLFENVHDDKCSQIQKALECMLTRDNIIRDSEVAMMLNSEFTVPIDRLVCAPSLVALNATPESVLQAAMDSAVLSVDNNCVRPDLNARRTTLMLREMPPDTKPSEVVSLLANCPHLAKTDGKSEDANHNSTAEIVEIRPDVNSTLFVTLSDEPTTQAVAVWLKTQLFKGHPLQVCIKPEHNLRAFFKSYAAFRQPVYQPMVPGVVNCRAYPMHTSASGAFVGYHPIQSAPPPAFCRRGGDHDFHKAENVLKLERVACEGNITSNTPMSNPCYKRSFPDGECDKTVTTTSSPMNADGLKLDAPSPTGSTDYPSDSFNYNTTDLRASNLQNDDPIFKTDNANSPCGGASEKPYNLLNVNHSSGYNAKSAVNMLDSVDGSILGPHEYGECLWYYPYYEQMPGQRFMQTVAGGRGRYGNEGKRDSEFVHKRGGFAGPDNSYGAYPRYYAPPQTKGRGRRVNPFQKHRGGNRSSGGPERYWNVPERNFRPDINGAPPSIRRGPEGGGRPSYTVKPTSNPKKKKVPTATLR